VTSRIITKEDIENVLAYIGTAKKDGLISDYRAKQYTAFVVFGAFTGQRSLSTIAKLTVGQFREALQSNNLCVEVLSSQDKIKMQHYVPLHPQVIHAVQPLLDGKSDDTEILNTTRSLCGSSDNKYRLHELIHISFLVI
jgi:hypothetical protein